MKFEKAIAAALEPVVDEVLRLEKEVEKLQLTPGPKGDPGADGKDADPATVAKWIVDNHAATLKGDRGQDGVNGKDGQDRINGKDGLAGVNGKDGLNGKNGLNGKDGLDGVGVNVQMYKSGEVYRKDTFVTANLGQIFVSLKDTADPTDTVTSWQRIGTAGLRHRGTFKEDETYTVGDIYVKDYGSFLVLEDRVQMLCGRGAKGERGLLGPAGADGKNGADGKDGSKIIAAEVTGFKAAIVVEDHEGNIDHLELDFTDSFGKALADMEARIISTVRAEYAALYN